MKNLLFFLFFFACVGMTAAQSGATILVELGHGTVRAGLANGSGSTVTVSSSINWGSFTEADFQSTMSQVFAQLNVTPSNTPVFVTHAALNVPSTREKMAQVLMGTFQCPSMYAAKMTQLGLFSAGKTTGFAIHAENNSTSFVPYIDGFLTSSASSFRLDQAISDIDAAQLAHDLIQDCPIERRGDLYGSIVLFGSNSSSVDVGELHTAIVNLAPPIFGIKVERDASPENEVWKGMKSLFEMVGLDAFFTQAEFQSGGALEINRKIN